MKPLQVLIVTPQGRGGAGGIDRIMDQLRVLGTGRAEVALHFAISRGPHILTSLFFVPFTAARIIVSALEGRLDLVHLNLASNASTYRKVFLSWICRLVGVPYVIHLHGSRFHKFWAALPPLRKRVVDDFFRHAGGNIVLGQVWREVLLTHLPDLEPRIRIVANATASRPAAAGNQDTPHILFLGQLGERKGVPDLLAALASLGADQPWRATVAGNGDLTTMRRLADELGLGERVSMPGWVGSRDVDGLIDSADILVLPSYDENLPMSVIEGMAAGLAVVATPVGATEDIIHHDETGLLVAPGDVEGQRAALDRLLSDRALRQRLGSAARHHHEIALDAATYLDRLLVPWQAAARQ